MNFFLNLSLWSHLGNMNEPDKSGERHLQSLLPYAHRRKLFASIVEMVVFLHIALWALYIVHVTSWKKVFVLPPLIWDKWTPLVFFYWITTGNVEFTDWSHVNQMFSCRELTIFCQIWMIMPPPPAPALIRGIIKYNGKRKCFCNKILLSFSPKFWC